jgi:hypothetical protein
MHANSKRNNHEIRSAEADRPMLGEKKLLEERDRVEDFL